MLILTSVLVMTQGPHQRAFRGSLVLLAVATNLIRSWRFVWRALDSYRAALAGVWA